MYIASVATGCCDGVSTEGRTGGGVPLRDSSQGAIAGFSMQGFKFLIELNREGNVSIRIGMLVLCFLLQSRAKFAGCRGRLSFTETKRAADLLPPSPINATLSSSSSLLLLVSSVLV